MLYCMFWAFEGFDFRISDSLECIYHLHLERCDILILDAIIQISHPVSNSSGSNKANDSSWIPLPLILVLH